MKYEDFSLEKITKVLNRLGGEKGIEKFLRGDLVVVRADKLPLDLNTRVDRSYKWHDCFRPYDKRPFEIVYPEFETSGPEQYNLKDLKLLTPLKNDSCNYSKVYEQLKQKDLLKKCLNLQDGISIKAKGHVVFSKIFKKKKIFLWKSVVEVKDNNNKLHLLVPLLVFDGKYHKVFGYRVELNWYDLEWSDFHYENITPIFKD